MMRIRGYFWLHWRRMCSTLTFVFSSIGRRVFPGSVKKYSGARKMAWKGFDFETSLERLRTCRWHFSRAWSISLSLRDRSFLQWCLLWLVGHDQRAAMKLFMTG